MIIPAVHIPINNTSNFGFTAFFSMIKDGRLNAVTAIINDKIVPSSAPFDNKASATGIVPNIRLPEDGSLLRYKVSLPHP